jgi:hypothetical protein
VKEFPRLSMIGPRTNHPHLRAIDENIAENREKKGEAAGYHGKTLPLFTGEKFLIASDSG